MAWATCEILDKMDLVYQENVKLCKQVEQSSASQCCHLGTSVIHQVNLILAKLLRHRCGKATAKQLFFTLSVKENPWFFVMIQSYSSYKLWKFIPAFIITTMFAACSLHCRIRKLVKQRFPVFYFVALSPNSQCKLKNSHSKLHKSNMCFETHKTGEDNKSSRELPHLFPAHTHTQN